MTWCLWVTTLFVCAYIAKIWRIVHGLVETFEPFCGSLAKKLEKKSMFLSLLAAAIAVASVETTATGTRQKIRTGTPIPSVVAAAGYSGWKSSCCPVMDQ